MATEIRHPKHEKPCVLIVGAASVIGKAAVGKLLSSHWQVVAADLDTQKLALLESEHASRRSDLDTLHMDMTNRRSVTEGLDWIALQHKQLNSLIISAGVHSTCPVEYLPDDIIHSVIDVNLIAH